MDTQSFTPEHTQDTVDNLRSALETRDVIGQAKGILMERHGIDADAAYRRLVEISQRSNVKLHDIAAMITGAMEVDGCADVIRDA